MFNFFTTFFCGRPQEDGKFEEFSPTRFHADHEESALENWLESNPDGILEDGKLLMIGRQVTTNPGSIIDLPGFDRKGNTVVIELKRDRTPMDTLAQALEYASFVVVERGRFIVKSEKKIAAPDNVSY